ncbi:MAG: hypothetical protein J6P20_05885 [Oscillospiraceae bacterium]|nr:hypothetical protein [Oscillospiraceae bacterium]
MRMTNEEFQAEVFRRSQVYFAERRRSRRRLFTGAAAFAGCFVIAVGALALRGTMTNMQSQDCGIAENINSIFSAKNASSYADSAADCADAEASCSEAAEESEAYCGESAESSAQNKVEQQSNQPRDAKTHYKSSDATAGLSPAPNYENQDNTASDSAAESAEAQEELPAEEYFSALGINPPPEMLGGYKLHCNPTESRVLGQRNMFTYIDETGTGALVLYLEPEGENSLLENIVMHHSDEGEKAEFTLGNARVVLEGKYMTLQDTDALTALVRELQEALRIQ